MTGWYALQLVFDIAVCLLVIFFVLREARNGKNAPDLEGLRTLVRDFKDAVERSEKAALNLDSKLKSAGLVKQAPPSEEVSRLKTATKGNGGNPRAQPPGLNSVEEQKRKVGMLYRQGVSKGEISRQLAIPLPEVELIIALLPSDD
jgi:hypothetical protein